MEEKQRQHEFDLRRLDRGEFENRPLRGNDSYRHALAMKFVPKFEPTDIEHYLMSFQKESYDFA